MLLCFGPICFSILLISSCHSFFQSGRWRTSSCLKRNTRLYEHADNRTENCFCPTHPPIWFFLQKRNAFFAKLQSKRGISDYFLIASRHCNFNIPPKVGFCNKSLNRIKQIKTFPPLKQDTLTVTKHLLTPNISLIYSSGLTDEYWDVYIIIINTFFYQINTQCTRFMLSKHPGQFQFPWR